MFIHTITPKPYRLEANTEVDIANVDPRQLETLKSITNDPDFRAISICAPRDRAPGRLWEGLGRRRIQLYVIWRSSESEYIVIGLTGRVLYRTNWSKSNSYGNS